MVPRNSLSARRENASVLLFTKVGGTVIFPAIELGDEPVCWMATT